MKVKICGITRLEDGLAAAEAGADLIGFNFYPASPRYLEIAACQEITAALRSAYPAVKLVGVFVNAAPADITAVLDACGLNFAQLTGNEMLIEAGLTNLGMRAFAALRLSDRLPDVLPPALPVDEMKSVHIPAFLIDAHLPGVYGGTGQLADWDLAAELATRYPILLAGGLTPDNVRAGIDRVRPWGVDVASGVEKTPGIKDHDKMRLFVQNAKSPARHNV